MVSRYIIRKLQGKVNRAIYGYNLIDEGDKIMVGLSSCIHEVPTCTEWSRSVEIFWRAKIAGHSSASFRL